MNPEQLLRHFDRIAEAPDAVQRLRRFIIDLAVRGKLVEQDPEDEPASELLKRLQAEKARLVKGGEIRKPRDLSDEHSVVQPFHVPANWRWCRLDAVGAIIGGGTPSAADAENFADPGEGIPWLTPADLGGYTGLYIARGSRDLSKKGLKTSSATMLPAGSVLFTSRAPIGYVAIAANPISTNQGFKSVVPYVGDCSRFIALAMKTFAPEIDAKAPGTTFKEVSGKIVAGIPFPLPPLAEQHRIVAKVDELMALCDRLEAAQNKREQRRDRLVAASLNRINQPAPSAEGEAATAFREHARFHLDHLPRLTTRAEHIKSLRQAILNLAVRGRLVPQDPNDEPAWELLHRITAEHEALILRKELRKKSRVDPVSSNNPPFQVPPPWTWCRLGNLFKLVTDGAHHTPQYIDAGIPFLSVKDVSSGRISFDDTRFISEEQHSDLCNRCRPEKGDILLTKVGTTGIAVPVKTDREFSIFVSVALLKFSQRNLSQDYLCYLLNSPFVKQQSADNTQGIGNQNLVLRLINSFALPIPPLAEQHRIVAKVDELMAVCDRLEAQLTATQTNSRRLLEAVLHEALAPAMEEAA